MRVTESQPRVLVVDDEENVAFLIASALRVAGYEAIAAPATPVTPTVAIATAASVLLLI